jgi:hypothetical protein
MRGPLEVQQLNRRFSLIAIVALLLAMATTLAGCSFGAPRISLTFVPNTVRLEVDQPINVSGTITLDGFGLFTLKSVILEYLDTDGQGVDDPHLPTGGQLEEAITLFGTMGLVSESRSLTELNNGEKIVPTVDWWAVYPRPVKIVFTFLDGSGKPVGGGELGLEWGSILG